MNNTSLLGLQISPSSGTPIYRQLMAQVQRLIAGGLLAPGDELPSVRNLAERLEINPMTVSKAYSGLELQGYLSRQRGKGMVVADGARGDLSLEQRIQQLEPSVHKLLMEAKQLGVDQDALLQHIERLAKQQ